MPQISQRVPIQSALVNLAPELLDLVFEYLGPEHQHEGLQFYSAWSYGKSLIMTCSLLYMRLRKHVLRRVSIYACASNCHGWQAFLHAVSAPAAASEIRHLNLKWCRCHPHRRVSFDPGEPAHRVLQHATYIQSLRYFLFILCMDRVHVG